MDKEKIKQMIKELRAIDSKLMKYGLRVNIEKEFYVFDNNVREITSYYLNPQTINLKNFHSNYVDVLRLKYKVDKRFPILLNDDGVEFESNIKSVNLLELINK